MNVAIIGGARFDHTKLEQFMVALAKKHPEAVIFTGNGRGAENEVVNLAKAIGLKGVRPPLHPEWFGDEALMCQINSILTNSGWTAPVILVGTGARVTRAKEIIHRVGRWDSKNRRLVHEIAKLPNKERPPPPRRAKKPVHD